MELRQLGQTDIRVTPIALGCWPISGMTTIDVNDADSVATIQACFGLGVNFLDTAYCYGARGESERLVARAIAGRRDELVIATKGGIHWNAAGERVFDGSPARLRLECEESLRRLETDRVELYYLHAPDPGIPIAESAGGLRDLFTEGKIRSVGVSNATLAQLEAFAAECPLSAFQPPYNMLQREIEADTLPWCRQRGVSVMVYWPLMNGMLTGKFARDHQFPRGDSRPKYPMYQGAEWQKNQDFIDELRTIAADTGHTVAQVVINWTIHRAGVTAALCGARRPDQIRDNAAAVGWRLSDNDLARIDAALARRGEIVSKTAL
jgi:aryl-alcohol dehydrogenase-like predicted oxidoreductase